MLAVILLLLLGHSVSEFNVKSNAGSISLQVKSDGSYSISVGGTVWLNSGPTFFRGNNRTLSTEDGSLKVANQTTTTGTDAFGAFNATQFSYLASSGNFQFVTIFQVYSSHPLITFEASFPDAVSGMSAGNSNGLASSFPSFLFEGNSGSKGYVTYGFFGASHIGNWDSASNPPGGGSSGVPFAIWDRNMANTIVISPLTNFMALNSARWSTASNAGVLGFGLVGTMESIPKGWSYKTMIYADNSFNVALLNWGILLRQYYGKTATILKNDMTNNYISYWTDNGACYYYWSGSTDYQTTLIDVYNKSVSAGIPFKSLQLDSWWYYKGTGNGVKNWTSMPSIFPDGIPAVESATHWPITGHNRYWSSNTDYATQNGGKYTFVIEPSSAGGQDIGIPNDQSFWDFLLSSSKQQWNLAVYEQDWLSTTWDELNAIKQDVNLGRNWLLQMGSAATKNNQTVQYCMAYARHFLQSVEIPSVTQIRVSGDYHQNSNQWQIGDSTALADALGLAAFKDTFRSTNMAQPCANSDVETAPSLVTTVALLSGGPVGPSDHIDDWDVALLQRTVMKDGRLLKPTYPAKSIDATYLYRAFTADGPNGFVWDALSVVSNFIFHHIIVVDLAAAYNLTTIQLISYNRQALAASVVFASGNTNTINAFDSSHSLPLKACGTTDFQLYHTAPILSNGWALLGETGKINPLSDLRFNSITVSSSSVSTVLHGVSGESVSVSAAQETGGVWKATSYSCTIPASGTATLTIPAGTCA